MEIPSPVLPCWRSSLRFVNVTTAIMKNKNISLERSGLHCCVVSDGTFLALFRSCNTLSVFLSSLSSPHLFLSAAGAAVLAVQQASASRSTFPCRPRFLHTILPAQLCPSPSLILLPRTSLSDRRPSTSTIRPCSPPHLRCHLHQRYLPTASWYQVTLQVGSLLPGLICCACTGGCWEMGYLVGR